MSLRAALDALPSDRETQSDVREIVSFFSRHPGEWFSAHRVASVTDIADVQVSHVLGVLGRSYVLDSDDDEAQYRYQTDALLDLEIKRFLRRADTHSGMLQSNVDKFRRRYGER
jgi:hypothetical protein